MKIKAKFFHKLTTKELYEILKHSAMQSAIMSEKAFMYALKNFLKMEYLMFR